MKTLTAPAKVNLALDILGARSDGYHDMKMVMQTISLCDTVSVEETASGFELRTDGDFIPAGKKTLEQRAAEAFFEAAGFPMPGLRVTLEKVTPAYAGLGGGSADVAALLRILRDNYAPEMSTEELERIGFTVGSDMPFCVRGGTALAEGRGEVLMDLKNLSFDCTSRLGLVWNNAHWFAGASVISHLYMYRKHRLSMTNSVNYLNIYAGFFFARKRQYR